MRKNVASQVVAFQAISATDGSAVTSGTPVVYYTLDGGTQGTGTATPVHEGNGQWSWVPTQAETNGNHLAYTFVLTGCISQCINVYTVSFDPHDTVRLGLTALPNAAADAAGGLVISDAGGLNIDTVASDVAAILVDTGTYIPNALVTIDTVVDAILVDTGTDIPTLINTVDNVVDAILVDTAEIGAAGAGLTAIPWNAAWDTEVQSEVNDGLVAFFTSAAALVDLVWDEATSGHTTAGTTGKAVADAATGSSPSAIADAVWDEALSGHLSAGSTGEALNAAGSAGDPWTTTLPGAYTGSQAGKMLSDILTDTAEIGAAGAGLTEAGGTGDQFTGLPVSVIAGAVWNADTSTYNAADSFGQLVNLLDVASFADAVWDDSLADHNTANTLGAAINSILDDTGTSGVVVASGSKTGYSLTATTGLGNQTANITGSLSGSVGSVLGGINTTAGTITTLDALDTAQDSQHTTTQALVSSSAIATSVWNAATATYGSAGSYGLLVESLSAAGDPWSVAIPGAYTAGTAGYIVGTYLDAQVSSVSGGGAGLYTVTVTVADSNGDALQGARVNVDGTTQTLTTLSNGIVTFNLDAGTYSLVVSPPAGYQTPANTAIVVAADASTTITLTAGSSGVGWLG